MKKLYIIASLSIASLSLAQVKTNQGISQGGASGLTPFFDASSSTTWNSSTNDGKGFVFPRTDLTTLAKIIGPTRPGNNNAPTRYDGMIVYNVGTGAPKIGKTETPNVTPGFYYYRNTTNDLQGGHWVRIGSGDVNMVPVNHKEVDVTFNGSTYAKLPENTLVDGEVFVNAYLINKTTGEKVGSVKFKKDVEIDGKRGDYVFSANGSLYTTLDGNYKLVADIQK